MAILYYKLDRWYIIVTSITTLMINIKYIYIYIKQLSVKIIWSNSDQNSWYKNNRNNIKNVCNFHHLCKFL